VEALWSPGPLELALLAAGRGPQPANDANVDLGGGYGMLALRALWRVPLGPRRLELLGRIDILTNRAVAGSVIVNESSRCFVETAAPRAVLIGLRWVQLYRDGAGPGLAWPAPAPAPFSGTAISPPAGRH
jgi:hypothetical protein